MASSGLTPHDCHILEKIKDPESAPSVPLLIDASLPRDPHVTDAIQYEKIISSEGQIIRELQALEAKILAYASNPNALLDPILANYDETIKKLGHLINSNPTYASAYNNQAQALRRKYGDSVLLKTSNPVPSLLGKASLPEAIMSKEASMIITSLNTAISLLTPATPFAPISPQAAKTLSQAHTQRGALYYTTAKQMYSDPGAHLRVESDWSAVDLEEMASRDFMMGGRYGNEIAKGLAVATNPTAKLCGSIVREAMRKEFGELAA